jgi:hypothetical protein
MVLWCMAQKNAPGETVGVGRREISLLTSGSLDSLGACVMSKVRARGAPSGPSVQAPRTSVRLQRSDLSEDRGSLHVRRRAPVLVPELEHALGSPSRVSAGPAPRCFCLRRVAAMVPALWQILQTRITCPSAAV